MPLLFGSRPEAKQDASLARARQLAEGEREYLIKLRGDVDPTEAVSALCDGFLLTCTPLGRASGAGKLRTLVVRATEEGAAFAAASIGRYAEFVEASGSVRSLAETARSWGLDRVDQEDLPLDRHAALEHR